MGGCCSIDTTPDIPQNIKPDPDFMTPINVVTARLGGMFSFGRDFGVWDGQYPDNEDDRKEKMWFWINKSTDPNDSRLGKIDIETFEGRGENPEDPKKGRVMYTATVTERPHFESFQRIPHTSRDRYFGLYESGYDSEDDGFYLNHPTHRSKARDGGRALGAGIITKWRLHTTAICRDGEKGRGVQFGQIPLYLEVFSKGTVVTTYQEKQEEVIDYDSDGNATGSHWVTKVDKDETEFVDRIEYRLVFNGMIWAMWSVDGDSRQYNYSAPVTMPSPFYDLQIEGGWFSPSTRRIITKPGIDPALAVLFAHLCSTEYSVAELKNDLKIRTPDRPNYNASFGLNGNSMYQSPMTINQGSSQFVYVVPTMQVLVH